MSNEESTGAVERTEPLDAFQAVRSLLWPDSLAIIGASGNPDGLASKPVQYLLKHGYAGRIHPVNPNHPIIHGLLSLKSIGEASSPVDVALLLVANSRVLPTIKECGEAGVKVVIVVSGGYAEAGAEGIERQHELKAAARRAGVRLIGPNCNGAINTANNLALGWQPILEEELKPGGIALIAQSGSFISAAMSWLNAKGIGIRYAVSCGNEADIGFEDYLRFMIADPEVRTVVGFLEASRRPAELAALAKEALAAGKPLIVVKIGMTQEAARAAASHTGAMVGSPDAYRALFLRYGVLAVKSFEEIAGTAALFASRGSVGRRIALLSVSGGMNGWVGDLLPAYRISFAELAEDVVADVERRIPSISGVNPIDLTGAGVEPDLFEHVVRRTIADDNADVLAIAWALMPIETSHEWVQRCIAIHRDSDKAMVVLASAGRLWKGDEDALQANGIPVFVSVDSMLASLDNVARFGEYSDMERTQPLPLATTGEWQSGTGDSCDADPRISAVVRNETIEPSPHLDSSITTVLQRFGIPCTPTSFVHHIDELPEVAESIGYPVALKVVSPQIAHRAKVGGVSLGIEHPKQLLQDASRIRDRVTEQAPDATLLGFELQPMAKKGLEVILGLVRSDFGPLLLVGSGGVSVEVMRDYLTVLCPLSAAHVLEVLRHLKIWPQLSSVGPDQPDLDALVDVSVKLSQFAASGYVRQRGGIDTLDLNPVLVHNRGAGVSIVDASVRWVQPSASYIQDH